MHSIKILCVCSIFTLSTYMAQSVDNLQIKKANPLVKDKQLPSFDLYGAVPIGLPGLGFGFGLFSKPYLIEQLDVNKKLQVSLGGDFYLVENRHKNLGIAPLAAPESGDSKVSISQFNLGFNAVARFMLSSSGKISPYLDLFGGLRAFSTDLNITPLNSQTGYESSTSQNLSTVGHWNYGTTFGVLYSLGNYAKLNLGLMYTTSPYFGQIENLNTTRIESGSVVTEKTNTPKNTLILKVGFTFLLEKSTGQYNCQTRRSSGFGISSMHTGSGSHMSNHVNISVRPSK